VSIFVARGERLRDSSSLEVALLRLSMGDSSSTSRAMTTWASRGIPLLLPRWWNAPDIAVPAVRLRTWFTGHGVEHSRLEEELAAFTGRERALLFSTGYMANLAVITTLAGRGETVLLDRLSHASLIDGGLLSGARFKRYTHADAAAAESALAADAETAAVVATDGVFSMDGDVGPLDSLARSSQAHGAWLVVDDAHGLGVLGASGRGAVEHFELSGDDVPVLVGTLGKAFGSFGAFVAGSGDLIELLMQKARSYIYTTALPQPVAAASRKALEIAQRESWRRERVLTLAGRFRAGAQQLGVPVMMAAQAHAHAHGAERTANAMGVVSAVGPRQPLTPIQPVIVGSAETAMRLQRNCLLLGFA